MKERKGSSHVAKHRENPAACIVVASEINLSPFSLMGREALYRPPNEAVIRGIAPLPHAGERESRCAPVLVVD